MDYVVTLGKEEVLVCFGTEFGKLGLKDIRQAEERMAQLKLIACVMVIDGNVTPPSKVMIERMAKEHPAQVVEVFRREELMFDLHSHELVPRHTLLDPQQREALLRRFASSALPRMLSVDPMARYLGLKRGQVVHVQRTSPNGGFHDFYRIVT